MSFPSAHHEAVSRRYQHLMRYPELSMEQETELKALEIELSRYRDMHCRDVLLERIRLNEAQHARLMAELYELDRAIE